MNDRCYQAIQRQNKTATEQRMRTLFFNKHGDPIDAKTYIRVVWKPLFEKKEINPSYGPCHVCDILARLELLTPNLRSFTL